MATGVRENQEKREHTKERMMVTKNTRIRQNTRKQILKVIPPTTLNYCLMMITPKTQTRKCRGGTDKQQVGGQGTETRRKTTLWEKQTRTE